MCIPRGRRKGERSSLAVLGLSLLAAGVLAFAGCDGRGGLPGPGGSPATQCGYQVTPGSLVLDCTSSDSASSITVRNTGNADLDWTLNLSAGCSFVLPDVTSGSLSPGAEQVVNLSLDCTAIPLQSGLIGCALDIQTPSCSPTSTTVVLQVVPPCGIGVDTTQVDLSCGPAGPASATVQLSNLGASDAAWAATVDQPWLSSQPSSGTLSAGASVVVAVAADCTQLPPLGTSPALGSVVFDAPACVQSPQTVNVSATAPCSIATALTGPSTLSCSPGGATSTTVTLTNLGGEAMAWSAASILAAVAVTPSAGTLAPGASISVQATADCAQLSGQAGPLQADLVFQGSGCSVSQATVSLQVVLPCSIELASPPPPLVLSCGQGPSGTTFTLRNAGGSPLAWTASASCGFLSLSPAGGALNPGDVQVVSLAADCPQVPVQVPPVSCTVQVDAPGCNGDPLVVPVTVLPPCSLSVGPEGGAVLGCDGSVPASTVLQVTNLGGEALSWNAQPVQADCNFIVLTPSGGMVAPGETIPVTASIDCQQVPMGTQPFDCPVLFSAPGCSPAAVDVVVTIVPNPVMIRLNTPRSRHTTTQLLRYGPGGVIVPAPRILVAGGIGSASNALDTGEVLDVSTMPPTSTPVPNTMGEARSFHRGIVQILGSPSLSEVYLLGGSGAGGGAAPSADVYLGDGPFDPPSTSLRRPRFGHSATWLPDGRILVAGGMAPSGDRAEIFDPITTPGSPTSTLTSGVLRLGRAWHQAALVLPCPGGSGEIVEPSVLLLGGESPSGSGQTRDLAEAYVPSQDRFVKVRNEAAPRSRGEAVTLRDGRLIVIGGETNGALQLTSELFDPCTARFSAAASLAQGRIAHTATLLGNGQVLIAGGLDAPHEQGGAALASVELYDPVLDAFTACQPMAVARAYHGAVRARLGGRETVLFIGGEQESPFTALDDVEVYKPSDHCPGFLASTNPDALLLLDAGDHLGGIVLGGAAVEIPVRAYTDSIGVLRVQAEFRTGRDSSWIPATLRGFPTGAVQLRAGPEGRESAISWDTDRDLPGYLGPVRIRLRTLDAPPGDMAQLEVLIDNTGGMRFRRAPASPAR